MDNTFTITIHVSPTEITHEITEKPIGITEAQYDALIIKALGVTGGRMANKLGGSEYADNIIDSLADMAKDELE